MIMRTWRWVGLLAAGALCSTLVFAQAWPNKPVRVVVPFTAGSATDILARTVGQKLGEMWGQQVVVDNRAGAGGTIGAGMVAKAPADGYTLMVHSAAQAVNPFIYPSLPYDTLKDFVQVAPLAGQPNVLVTAPATGYKTVSELVADAKKKPGALNFGSAGIGSGGHLAGELYKLMTGVKAEHIPYKGTGPAVMALLAGEYQFNFAGLQGAQPHVRSGRLRAIAVSAPRRVAALPELPAVAEALPGFEVVGWYGIIGPANLPGPILSRLHTELVKILNQPEVRERIVVDGSEPVGSSPEDFRQFMLADLAKWARVVKESGAKLE